MKKLSKLLLTLAFVLCLNPTTADAKMTYEVPSNNSFKAFMDYRTITSTGSKQYKLQELCSTTELGLRVYDGRYTVAIGTGYNAPVGTYIDVLLENGKTLPCVVGDIKQDCHTNATNMYVEHNGNAVEFIVDSNRIPSSVSSSGSVGSIKEFAGDVTSITTYESKAEAEGHTYLVTNKYVLESPGVNVCMAEIVVDDVTVTIQLSEEDYNLLSVGTSRLEY